MWNATRNWTRIAVSISWDDNHYTTGTSYPKHGIQQAKRVASWVWYGSGKWWWGSASGDLGIVQHSFLAITPVSTLIKNWNFYSCLIYGTDIFEKYSKIGMQDIWLSINVLRATRRNNSLLMIIKISCFKNIQILNSIHVILHKIFVGILQTIQCVEKSLMYKNILIIKAQCTWFP